MTIKTLTAVLLVLLYFVVPMDGIERFVGMKISPWRYLPVGAGAFIIFESYRGYSWFWKDDGTFEPLILMFCWIALIAPLILAIALNFF